MRHAVADTRKDKIMRLLALSKSLLPLPPCYHLHLHLHRGLNRHEWKETFMYGSIGYHVGAQIQNQTVITALSTRTTT